MANGRIRCFSSKRQRQQPACSRPDTSHPSAQKKPSKLRWHQTIRFLLLLCGLITVPIPVAASSSSIDYGSLTLGKWSEICTPVATDSTALREIYSSGPRVRAKIMVSSHISMSDLQAGEAIFRQQITEIVEVGTIDRVQLEYLQTDACSETEQGAYYVALGISALPPPKSSSSSYDSSDSALMLPVIEAERERIIKKLRYGSVLATGNVTVDSLSLFGVPMTLVDIVVDGESFAQLFLKPWVGVQLVIASASSAATGISSDSEHYATKRDAFQDLRLRFVLADRLQSLQVRASDIIVQSPTALLPFTTYQADAGVLEIEVHVHDMQYAAFVEMYLLGDNNSPNSRLNSALAETFNGMEPMWKLLAMAVDSNAGELYFPTSEPSPSLNIDSTDRSITASELTFEIYNITQAQLERTKWFVLDFIRVAIAHIGASRVRFGRIRFPSSSFELPSFAIHNDGGDDIPTEGGFPTNSVFDPINAINWMLSFKVEPVTTGAFDSSVLAEQITAMQNTVEMGLQKALGFTVMTSILTNRSVAFQGASDWIDPELSDASVVEPFVTFNLTLQVEPLDASGTILESPNFFQLHHVRCALVLLLQQVAVLNDQVTLVTSTAEERPAVKLDKSQHSWHRLLIFKYRATISDESQRRAIRSVIFSPRLASTISLYSGRTLRLIERDVDLHADGSPMWPQYLPGLLVAAPKVDNVSDGFVTANTSLLGQQETFLYDFDDPEPCAASGILLNGADVCSSAGTLSSGLCIKLRFTGTSQVAPIFLRGVQSLHPVASSSVSLPPANTSSYTADTSSMYPAPWVLVGDRVDNGETVWTLHVDRSASTSTHQSVRLTFAAVDNMQYMSITTPFTIDLKLDLKELAAFPAVQRRQFGDLAVVATSDQPLPAFISAELPELMNNGVEITGINITLNLQEPRVGGLYSASLLEEVAPTCSACTAILADCNSRLECRAFSACASVLLDADLTLVSTMLQEDTNGTNMDASWLLEDCLSPSDGTVWSSAMHEVLVSSCTCLWQNHCPLGYSAALNRQLVLDYSHGEQVLTFQLADGFASLSFTLDAGDDESTFEFVEDFTANTTDVTAQLNAMLTEMYRAAQSNVATVGSTLATTEDATTGSVTATVTIQYLFLGRLPLPLVEVTQSGNNEDAYVDVTVPKESLYLRVIKVA